MWNFVTTRFEGFIRNIQVDDLQMQDVRRKAINIGKRLHLRYYNSVFDPNTIRIVGSHGKGTANANSDLDVLFLLPNYVFHRISDNEGNGQSQLLQEFRKEMQERYVGTEHKADGQVVISDFNSIKVEIVPAFLLDNGAYLTCDTKNGGEFNITNLGVEAGIIHRVNTCKAGRVTHLVQMMKCWTKNKKVPLKSVCLEVAAWEFLLRWNCGHHLIPMFWYDWMLRDFFAFLLKNQHRSVLLPGSNEELPLGGNAWIKLCEAAYGHVLKACDYESRDLSHLAEEEWREVFGARNFPRLSVNNLFKRLFTYGFSRPKINQSYINR